MRRSPNELHLYISEAKSFLSVYCATVSVHLLLHSWLLQWFPMGPTLLKGAPSNNGSMGPPESVPQTASGSVFCTAHGIMSLYFTMGRHFFQKLPLTLEALAPPSNSWFRLSPQTSSRSVQPFSQGLRTWPTDRHQTDRHTDTQTDHAIPCEAIGRNR